MPATIDVGTTRFQLIDEVQDMWRLSDGDGMVLAKVPEAFRKLDAFIAGQTVSNMVELGIHRGGSTAFFAERLGPRRLVAIDISEPVEVLERWIDRQGVRDRVRTFYGVDQADAARLRVICDEVFDGAPLDLIEDDASHELERTRSSFNTLFPRLRAGGVYIIEDWAWRQQSRGWEVLLPPAYKDLPDLAGLLQELVAASVHGKGLIEDIVVNEAFVAVRKGTRAVDGQFDIRNYG